jgi:hypothetical protein
MSAEMIPTSFGERVRQSFAEGYRRYQIACETERICPDQAPVRELTIGEILEVERLSTVKPAQATYPPELIIRAVRRVEEERTGDRDAA